MRCLLRAAATAVYVPPDSPVPTYVSPAETMGRRHLSLALHILVSNLHHHYDADMRNISTNDDTSLLIELTNRVKDLIDTGVIQPHDVHLAESLVSLLTHLNRLSAMSPESMHRLPIDILQPPSATNIYDTLHCQVSELQSHRYVHALLNSDQSVSQPPILAVEHSMAQN